MAVIMFAVLALFLTAPAAASVISKGGDSLTIGVPANRCPIFYEDPGTGEVIGIGVELMRTAAKEAGYNAFFVKTKEETLKDALDNDEYDVIMPFGSAITSTSGQPIIVSENLIQTPFTLVTEGRMDLPPINQLRVGMLRSLSGGAETVKEMYPGIEINLYDTMADSVKALRAGKLDALLHNSYVWSYLLQKPSYSDLMVQPSAMFSMDFRAGVRDTEKGRSIIERLNHGIAALSDTRRQAVILDYTSRKLYRYDFSDYFYQYGAVIILTAALFAALSVIIVQWIHSFRKEQAKKMQQLIDHDPLTGALSLQGFRRRVEELLLANPDTPYLLAYMNIKNFKYINDSLGRAAGDEFLRYIVNRSRETFSEKEAMARIEGDHFAVLRQIGGEQQLQDDDQDVIDSMRSYFTDQGKENRVQMCCGVYILTPKDYQHIDVDRMMDFARVAEKRVRDTRKDGYEFYNPEQWEKGKRISDIITHLPTAIQSEEIRVWYQPQINYDTGTIIGAEALCRWNHSKFGWLRPGEFIPTLEESGLIYELDCFIWDRVCRDLQKWNQQGLHRSVSVNLSRRDILADRNIPGHFFSLVQSYGIAPDQLRIEITESAFTDDPDLLIRTTVKLREFGFQVEMDDFGSGYSSLHMLKEVPVDRIKLDLNFLTSAGDSEKGRIIVTYIIKMIRSLGMELIAEGVENIAQANFLRSRGCSEMQGFFFFKPMALQEFEKLNGKIKAVPKAQT